MNTIKNNQKLARLHEEDQSDRSGDISKKDNDQIRKNDSRHRREVDKMISNNDLQTAKDYYRAAMIFQHGSEVSDFKKAASLAQKAIELGSEKAKWLYAAATDRSLVFSGRKQKFGTQFKRPRHDDGSLGEWELDPVDKRISDDTRAKYNVPSLGEAQAKIQKMNNKLED